MSTCKEVDFSTGIRFGFIMLKNNRKYVVDNTDCSTAAVLSAVSPVTEMFPSVSSCFRGNRCSRFIVPILDHRHSSDAGRRADTSAYDTPVRLSSCTATETTLKDYVPHAL